MIMKTGDETMGHIFPSNCQRFAIALSKTEVLLTEKFWTGDKNPPLPVKDCH